MNLLKNASNMGLALIMGGTLMTTNLMTYWIAAPSSENAQHAACENTSKSFWNQEREPEFNTRDGARF